MFRWWWCGALTDFLRQDFAALLFSLLRSWWWHESWKLMQRHKSNWEGSQWTEWTPRSRRKNDIGKKHYLCMECAGWLNLYTALGDITLWRCFDRLIRTSPLVLSGRHHERHLDQVTIHIQTSCKASNYAYVRVREKTLKPGPLRLKPVISI